MGQQDNADRGGARLARRQKATAFICAASAGLMIGVAFAAVPLYRLFCQVTGYQGTTQRSDTASPRILDRTITVRFDSNVRNMPWVFEPVERTREIRIGETALAFFRATNTSDRRITGTAVFNVAPEAVGIYFNKIQCFCFKEQTLGPGESAELPVTFFLDPKFAEDPETRGLTQITLSYTFYPAGRTGTPASNGS